LAIDPAVVLLAGSIVVLCATTAITALTLPSFSPQWWRRNRRPVPAIPMSYRRAADTAVFPALALPPAPRHGHRAPDGHDRVDDVETAWALIERLLEHDPDRLVDVLTRWIGEDLPDPDTEASPEENTPS
jgi:hypothetical protein